MKFEIQDGTVMVDIKRRWARVFESGWYLDDFFAIDLSKKDKKKADRLFAQLAEEKSNGL